MKIDLVKGLVIHDLRPLGAGYQSDRRGPICDLILADIPNTEHAINVATRILQRVCSLMSDSYFWSDNRDKGPTEFHEQFESWIDPVPLHREGKAVTLRHKYWPQGRIDKFLDIMVNLANLHGWEVDDRRKTGPSIEEEDARRDQENVEFLDAVTAIHKGDQSSPEGMVEMCELAGDIIEAARQMDTSPWRLLAMNAAGMCWCSPGGGAKVIPIGRKP